MPNSTLPGNTYLGDGQRTTAEMQAGLDQVAAWLNAAQAELNALTGTTFGEAAVRGVGSSAGQVPDKAVLDTRLGTAGNLGSIASEDAADYVSRAEFEGPTLVWSGSDSSPNMSELSEGGPGFYIVKDTGGAEHSIYIRSTTQNTAGSATIGPVGSGDFKIFVLEYTSSGDFRVEELDYGSGSPFLVLNLIEAIYKV